MLKTKTRYRYGDYGVQVRIESMTNPANVFWSSTGASYVLVDPERETSFTFPAGVDLVSVNGIGEIRWRVTPYAYDDLFERSDLEAIRHFNLDLPRPLNRPR